VNGYFFSDYHRTSASTWVLHASISSSCVLYVNALLANKSFRRKPESREISYLAWIPAFAGMTEENRLKISGNQILKSF